MQVLRLYTSIHSSRRSNVAVEISLWMHEKKKKKKKKKESWLQLNRITPYKSFRAYEAEQIGPLSNSRNINKCLIQRDEGSKNEQSKKFPLRIINIFHKDAQVKSK